MGNFSRRAAELCLSASLLTAITSAHPIPKVEPTPQLRMQVLGTTDLEGHPVTQPKEGQKVILSLALTDPMGQRLTDSDLLTVHEKKFHLFGFDGGLTNYIHIHPHTSTDQPDVWKVEVTFKKAGQYRLWANVSRPAPGSDHAHHHGDAPAEHHHHDGMSEDHGSHDDMSSGEGHHHPAGATDDTATTTIQVGGDSKPNPAPKKLTEKLEGTDGISKVKFFNADDGPSVPGVNLSRGALSYIGMRFSRTNGTDPHLRNYLGAPAHVVITDITGQHILHVHPEDEGNGNYVLSTRFFRTGDYRAFVQFQDQTGPNPSPSDLKTVELSFHVN